MKSKKQSLVKTYLPILRNHMSKQPKSVICSKCKLDLEVFASSMDVNGNLSFEIVPHKCNK